MYGGNSIDLCCCVWVDLSYDGAFLLSYCRTQINIRVRRFLDHSCLYDEILETSDPDMFIYILWLDRNFQSKRMSVLERVWKIIQHSFLNVNRKISGKGSVVENEVNSNVICTSALYFHCQSGSPDFRPFLFVCKKYHSHLGLPPSYRSCLLYTSDAADEL